MLSWSSHHSGIPGNPWIAFYAWGINQLLIRFCLAPFSSWCHAGTQTLLCVWSSVFVTMCKPVNFKLIWAPKINFKMWGSSFSKPDAEYFANVLYTPSLSQEMLWQCSIYSWYYCGNKCYKTYLHFVKSVHFPLKGHRPLSRG